MDSKLEAGYLAKLFTEPVYLLGYETEEKSSVVNKDLKAESSVLKQENKKIPVIPELPNHSPKISKKCILLYSSEEELKSSESEFLAKIMKACNVAPAEYECINFRDITLTDLASRYAYNKLVMFNVNIDGLKIEQYKCTQVKSTQIISADALWMIENNLTLKKQLWEQLQPMFGIIK